jgi:hypothetical protein
MGIPSTPLGSLMRGGVHSDSSDLIPLCAKCDQAKSSDHASCEVLRAPISRGAERPGRVRQGLRSWFMKHVMRLLLVTTLSLAGLTGLAPWRSSDG